MHAKRARTLCYRPERFSSGGGREPDDIKSGPPPQDCPIGIPGGNLPQGTFQRAWQQGPFCLRVSTGHASTGLAPSAPHAIPLSLHEISSLLSMFFNCGLHCKSKRGIRQGNIALICRALIKSGYDAPCCYPQRMGRLKKLRFCELCAQNLSFFFFSLTHDWGAGVYDQDFKKLLA